eukprot:2929865-Pleurochrysis_carterae.AAC.1
MQSSSNMSFLGRGLHLHSLVPLLLSRELGHTKARLITHLGRSVSHFCTLGVTSLWNKGGIRTGSIAQSN